MDEEFIFYIWDDLLFYRKYLTKLHPKTQATHQDQENCRVLVFPPMHKRYRFLLHKSIEEFFTGFFSFSVGLNEKRRTVICPEYVITRLVFLNDTSISPRTEIRAVNKEMATKLDETTRIETLPHTSGTSPVSDDGKSAKHKRPDRQLYVPRARRSVTKRDGAAPDPKEALKGIEDGILKQKGDTLEDESGGARTADESDKTLNATSELNEFGGDLNSNSFSSSKYVFVGKKINSNTPAQTVLPNANSEIRRINIDELSKTDFLSRDRVYENVISKRNATLLENADSELDKSTWDNLFDENGDFLDDQEINELTLAVGQVEIQRSKYDYLEFRPHDPILNEKDYRHVLEVYDFPPEYKTADLTISLSGFKQQGFSVQWVDDTHALAVFSSPTSANEVLNTKFPFLKVRPLSQAIPESKWKAKRNLDCLQPFKPRPQTSASLARRLVSGALGIKVQIPKEQRERERQKLIEAKESRKNVLNQRRDIWDGTA